MSKKEKIKSAFGKSWDLLTYSMQEHILNVHHWVDRSQNRMNLSPKDLGFDEKTECEVHCEFWRPIQLKGLENNNGWNLMEDFDGEDEEYFLFLRYSEHDGEPPIFTSVLSDDFEIGYFTHWKRIDFLNPPIY